MYMECLIIIYIDGHESKPAMCILNRVDVPRVFLLIIV